MFSRGKKMQRSEPLSPDEVLSKMENFCAYRERCPKEVKIRLAELGARGDIAAEIYTALQEDKFFDETRFAMAYARGKFRNNNWGKVRIRLELRSRDITPHIIQEALDAIDMEEYETVLYKMLQKKLLQYEGADKARDKAAASLIRSGFEPELVFRFLNKI